jgi:hypothetical protein
MDDEDVYGIPKDLYLSQEMLQNCTENVSASSFDEYLDNTLADNPFNGFGECMRATVVGLVSDWA